MVIHRQLRLFVGKGCNPEPVSGTRPAACGLSGRVEVSVTIAFRVARLMNVSIYDVISGTGLPPGVCKHCGRSQEE